MAQVPMVPVKPKWMVEVLDAIVAVNPDRIENIIQYIDKKQRKDHLAVLHNGENVLSAAIGDLESVKILLKYDANPCIPGETGLQPIHFAVKNNLVETVIVLCLYGADFNASVNEDNMCKPLLMKALEYNTPGCYDALHFLGAHIPDDQINKLLKNETTKQNYLTIQKYYKERSIRNNICTLEPDKKISIRDRFDNAMELTIWYISRTTKMFICRMLPEYLSICNNLPKLRIPDRASIISDIFVYKVNAEATCILDVHLQRPYDDINRYKEIILYQQAHLHETDTDNEITDTNVQYIGSGWIRIKEFKLKTSRSSSFITFALFERDKVDSNIIKSGEDSTLISSTDNKFRVHASAADTQIDHELHMAVVETEKSDVTSTDSGIITSNSDIYSLRSTSVSSVSSDGRPTTSSSARSDDSSMMYIVDVELPRPVRNGNDPFHALMSSEDNEDEWLECENIVEHDLTIECKKVEIKNALDFIVVQCKRITAKVRELVIALRGAKNNTKRTTKIFVKVEPISVELNSKWSFRITVKLCDKDYENLLNEIKRENQSLPREKKIVTAASAKIELDIKKTYQYALEVTHGEVEGPCIQPFLYQENLDKSKHFVVNCAPANIQILFGKILISKQSSSNKKKNAKQIPIEFIPNKTEEIKGDVYLNDKYLEKILTEKVGNKWFDFGICLGIPFDKLDSYESIGILKASETVLYKWRDKSYAHGEKERLDTFIKATFDAELPMLREEFLRKHLLKFEKRNEHVRNWITQYKGEVDDDMTRFDFRQLKSKAVSPLEDKFFLVVSRRLCDVETVAIRLGCRGVDVSDITNNPWLQLYHKRCKILVKVRNTLQCHMRFLEKLMRCLREEGYELTVREIEECVQAWKDSEIGQTWLSGNRGKGLKVKKIFQLTNN